MSRYRDFALFAFLAVAWGGSFVAIEAGLPYIPPVLFAAFRFDLAAVVLLASVALAGGDWLPRTRADALAILASGGFIIFANNVLLFLGQQTASSGVASILYSLNPILTTGFAWLLLREERLSPVGVFGILLGVVGVGIIARPDPGNFLAGRAVGKLLVVGAAASVALGSVLVRRVESTCSNTAATAWAMAFGAVVAHAVSPLVGESYAAVQWTDTAVVSVAYLGVVATAAAYAVYFDLLDRIGPVQINLISYAVPLVTAVAGWALLGQTITETTLLGFAVIVAGFALLKRHALAEELSGFVPSD